jgi:cytochrome P450
MGLMDEGDDKGLFASLDDYLNYLSSVGIYAEFHTTLHWLKAKFGRSGANHIGSFATAQINDTILQAKEDKSLLGRKDFAARLLRMHWDDPAGMPMVKVFATAITNVGAGSDTTSVSLSSILYNIMSSPACYQKVWSFQTALVRNDIDQRIATC